MNIRQNLHRIIVLLLLSAMMIIPTTQAAKADGNINWICSIDIGDDGKTWSYDRYLSLTNPVELITKVPASSFIRSTHGPCSFTIYNSENFQGRYVTLGTNLDKRIRAGDGGIDGSGETWRLRSIKIEFTRDQTCRLHIGGNGVRMTYFVGDYAKVPGMNRISFFDYGSSNRTADCRAHFYNAVDFWEYRKVMGYHDYRNGTVDPGFRVRSMRIIYY